MRAQMPCQTVEDLIRAEEAARKKLDSLYNDPELLDALARDPDPEFHALVDRQRKEATAEWKRVRLALERITRLPLDWERGGREWRRDERRAHADPDLMAQLDLLPDLRR